MKRRELIKGLTILPLAGVVAGNSDSLLASAINDITGNVNSEGSSAIFDGSLKPGPAIYQSIGVEPVINCRGTFTIIGGSIELAEVRAAMDSASRHFVQMDELADAVGKRLAQLTGAEWGMVTAGCAAALKMATAACVAGGNPEKLHRIPDLSGLEKNEVIIPAESFSAYDFAIQNIGVKIIRVNTLEELRDALSSKTAMIKLSGGNLVPGPMGLEAIAALAKPMNIPILADAAAEILTIPNVHLQNGATMVAYSGGKAICGPQCAGLLLGPKNILMSAWQASSPHHGPGRDNKVGREETLGMLAAVETWVKMDHAGREKNWMTWVNAIASRMSAIEHVKTMIMEPKGINNRSASLTISWDPLKLHLSSSDLIQELINSKPRITVGAGRNTDNGMTSISINASQMQVGQDKIVGDRIFELLTKKRSPKTGSEMNTPAALINGRWDLVVDYFSSKSDHMLYIEQDGNWIKGIHKTDFSTREISGSIEGNEIKFLSPGRRPAVSYTFSGTLDGDIISGKIDMGEFLTASFTARKNKAKADRVPIIFPTGRPMGN
ncbi:Seryl-tRNA(Sec) selenium transferase [Daejeonella rubra]|uniref:Seryl-tRNA(Sec) selenium transferase n=1 Tax=Daejeonella rubra TaxID=990371 RepID=A0A1G9YKM3_9SPHI|nr:aminotransferase class V-fold PLP-dependent enzyme [Daejeonella rubra]SDN09001.1 Seryl-tRNA(Sec) selenium transferase [Daejeonella rubra]